MKKTYNIAFIGGNIKSAIGMTHKIACQMDGKFKLVAGAFSRQKEVNIETANAYGIDISRVYEDYKIILKEERNNIDVIAVLVSTDLHEKIVIDCLNAGYNVICEKSLATSYESGKKIIQSAKENNKFLGVTYNYTGYPMIRVLKEKISKFEFGKIISIIIEMPQEGYIRYNADGEKPTPQNWRLKDYKIPTISLDLGSHLHNMIAFLIDEKPISLVATENSYGFFEGLIDDVNIIAKYSNNVDVQMWYSKSALGNRNGLMIRVFGTKASAQWYQMEPEILKINKNDGAQIICDRSNDLTIGLSSRYNRFKAGHPVGFIEAFANYYVDLYDNLTCFEKTKEYYSKYILPLNKTLEGLKMLENTHISAVENKWVECSDDINLTGFVNDLKVDATDYIEFLKNNNKKVFIYGAQDTAKRKLNLMKANNICVSGFFVDDEYYEDGLEIDGIKIYSKSYILNNFEKFNTVIGFYEYGKYQDVINSLLFDDKGSIIYFDETDNFDKKYFFENIKEFEQTYKWLEDKRSKEIFLAYLKSRILKRPKELIEYCALPQYFDDCLKIGGSCTFIDAGAYTGDTIVEFLKQTSNKFYKIYAFEADKDNAKILTNNCRDNSNIVVFDKGVWSSDTVLKFSSTSDMSSKIDKNGDIQIDVVALDNHLKDISDEILLKADIEGSELEMLKGARNLIEKYKPKIAICVYHKKEDLITIPQYIKSLNPEYKFYLRHSSSSSSNETVLYAI